MARDWGRVTPSTGGSGYESPVDGDCHFSPPLRSPNRHHLRALGRQDPAPDLEHNAGVNTLNGMLSKAQRIQSKVSIGDRIACFRWTWFTMTMATGGIANVLHTRPYNQCSHHRQPGRLTSPSSLQVPLADGRWPCILLLEPLPLRHEHHPNYYSLPFATGELCEFLYRPDRVPVHLSFCEPICYSCVPKMPLTEHQQLVS